MLKLLFKILTGLIAIIVVFFIYRLKSEASKSREMKAISTWENQSLGKCRLDKKNCVSSAHGNDGSNYGIAPISFEVNPIKRIAKMCQNDFKIIKQTNEYIQMTQQTPKWGFVDDIEFLYDGQKKNLHMRSASRVGYSDVGANRKRLEALINALR